MNWIERYVAEVKRYLPARNRDDVGDELQSLLEEELLAREADRERPLEAEELLRRYPELPEGLAHGSTVVLWFWMLGLLADLLTQGYRLMEGRGGPGHGVISLWSGRCVRNVRGSGPRYPRTMSRTPAD